MAVEDRRRFGVELGRARRARGLSLRALSAGLSLRAEPRERLSSAQLGNYEAGSSAPRWPGQVEALEDVLGVERGELSRWLGMPTVSPAPVTRSELDEVIAAVGVGGDSGEALRAAVVALTARVERLEAMAAEDERRRARRRARSDV